MAKFYLNGDIIDNGDECDCPCVSPNMLKEFIDGLNENEDIEIDITSFGGSCTAGNAMVSMLRSASANGHRTIAHIVSIAASMASVVACACDELILDSNAFMMVHLPYTCVEGNYEQIRKEADTLELFTKSLVSVYRSKFNLTDEEIIALLQAETWILGDDAETYGLKCTINKVDGELKVAASCKYGYKNIPRGLKKMEKKTIEEIEESPEKIEKTGDEKMKEEVIVKPIPTNEDGSTDEKKEPLTDEEIEELMPNEVKEKPDEKVVDMDMDDILEKLYEYERMIELLKNENEELTRKLSECEKPDEDKKEMVSKEECEKRVSGMQSKMQAKINDFTSQLKAKDEEIRTVRAELSSLNSKLEEATKELTEKSSALVEKENALAMLNAGVNAPAEELPTMKDGLAKCATPKDKVEFLKSGKYVR